MTPRPKIFALHLMPESVAARLEQWFDVDWNHADGDVAVVDLVARSGAYDAFLTTVTDPVPAAVFAAPTRRLRMVANFGVGVNLIDLDAARAHGVTVTNTPGVLTDCTADLTMTLMLMLLRRASEGERLLRAGQWAGWRPTHLLGAKVTGRRLGIVGMGRIGQAVAERARGFAMPAVYYSRTRRTAEDEAALGAYWQPLDQLLAESDVVSLHCPLTKETKGLLDRRRLALLRPHAVLINTARGGLIDEAALVDLVRAGRIGGVGLDVYQHEPAVSQELLGLERAVLLPHLGSATVETRTAMGMMACDNLEAFFEGRPVPNRVA